MFKATISFTECICGTVYNLFFQVIVYDCIQLKLTILFISPACQIWSFVSYLFLEWSIEKASYLLQMPCNSIMSSDVNVLLTIKMKNIIKYVFRPQNWKLYTKPLIIMSINLKHLTFPWTLFSSLVLSRFKKLQLRLYFKVQLCVQK